MVEDCLAKDPARRPSSSDVLLRLVGETRFLTGRLPRNDLPPPGPPPAPARHGRTALAAVAAFAAGAVLSGAAVYALAPPRPGALAAAAAPGPSASGPSPSSPSPSSSSAVVTTAPAITPRATTAPVATVPPKAENDVELPDVKATLHEHPQDRVRLAAYIQVKQPFKAFARDASGRFAEVGLSEEPRLSPDGQWVALNPWLKFQSSDMDHVRFRHMTTGETFTVQTVRKPETTRSPVWSRDGRRLLMSMMSEDQRLFVGFVVVDVAERSAVVVRTQRKDDSSLPFSFTPDGTVIRGYNGKKSQGVETYDMTGKVVSTRHWTGLPRNVEWFSPNGKQFSTVCPNKEDVCVWDAETGGRKATVEGIRDGARMIGWFDDDHLMLEEPGKKKGTVQVKVVDLLGRSKRVLADAEDRASGRQWAAVPR